MIKIQEQGRRLKITVGGELELLIPPVPNAVGVTLLANYTQLLNIGAGVVESMGVDIEDLSTELAELSLGRPVFKDPDAPTEREQKAQAEFEDLWEVFSDLRAAEQKPVFEAAFFWQVYGGGIDVANAHVDNGAGSDGREKAQALLFENTGLELISVDSPTSATGTNRAGAVVPLTNAPEDTNGTNSPEKSGTLSKLPANKQSRKPKATLPR